MIVRKGAWSGNKSIDNVDKVIFLHLCLDLFVTVYHVPSTQWVTIYTWSC